MENHQTNKKFQIFRLTCGSLKRSPLIATLVSTHLEAAHREAVARYQVKYSNQVILTQRS